MVQAPKICNRDLYVLLLCSIRYALGRSTYIVSDTCSIARLYWFYLTVPQREVIERDVLRELKAAELEDKKLGMDIDHQQWVSLCSWIDQHRHYLDKPAE